MTRAPRLVWLNGKIAGQHHLFDTQTGRSVTEVALGRKVEKTAGLGRSIKKHFVAVYVRDEMETVFLQVDAVKYPLDGWTWTSYQRRLGGARSELTVGRASCPTSHLRQWHPSAALLRRIDPAYDGLDASIDDFLADLHDIVSSERRVHWIQSIKSSTAGPWEEAPGWDSPA